MTPTRGWDPAQNPMRLAWVIACATKAERSVSGDQPSIFLGLSLAKGEKCARLFQSARDGRTTPRLRRAYFFSPYFTASER